MSILSQYGNSYIFKRKVNGIFNMDGYKKICSVSALKEKEGKRFFINDNEIALFKVDDKVYALDNYCPHQHAPIMYDGFVEEGCVVCPAHGWKFNLSDGCVPAGRRGLEIYPVDIRGGDVYVKISDKETKW